MDSISYTQDDYNNPYLAAFTADQVIHLGAGGLTPQLLDFILRTMDKQGDVGKIALIGVGRTSMVDLLLGLIDYSTKLKESRELIDKVREG